jgi:hypothetical protein
MDHLPRLQLDDEEGQKRTEKEIGPLQTIAGPHLCHMLVQEWFPRLSTGSFWADLVPLLLDGPFPDANIACEKFTPHALRTPKSLGRCHLLPQADRLRRPFRLAHARFGCVLPEHAETFTRPSQERLRLDEEQRLFPRSDHPGKAYQQQSIRLPAQGSFDLSMQDDQVVAEPRVFRQQFGFASGQIGECSQYQGGRRRFDPPGNIFLERVKAETDALLD